MKPKREQENKNISDFDSTQNTWNDICSQWMYGWLFGWWMDDV